MKTLCTIACLGLFAAMANGQNTFPASGSTGIGTTTPNASALLEVASTTKGVLVPRMTTAQRGNIASPATGLLVYQTDGTAGFYYYTGGAWAAVTPPANYWGLAGNAGTNPAVNFIGTTDTVPLMFKAENIWSGQINPKTANIAFGDYALYSITSGADNAAFGSSALYKNTSGGGNTAIGAGALNINTTGGSNTAVGDGAMQNNLTGAFNTAVGYTAGFGGNGTYNSFVGGYAGQYATGNSNAFFGYNAGAGKTNTASNNSFFGYQTGHNNTSGTQNAFFGFQAGLANTTGSYNTFYGSNAGAANTVAINNSFFGQSAGIKDSSGHDNTFAGNGAGYSNKTANDNTFVGSLAGFSVTTASNQVAVGYNALNASIDGTANVAVGWSALGTVTHGYYNTAVGYDADVNNASAIQRTAIGYNAKANENYAMVLGNASIVSIGGYTGWSNISDGRFKKNISAETHGLDFILKLSPITYNLDVHRLNGFLGVQASEQDMAQKEQKLYSGFVAQDVEKAAKQLGYDFSGVIAPADEKGHYKIVYGDFVVPLVKAVQELAAANAAKNAQLDSLQEQLADVKAELADLENKIAQLAQGKAAAQTSVILSDARLWQNLPNPFNQGTVIKYYLPENTGSAAIQVFEANGKLVKTISLAGKGDGQLTLDTKQLASGTYMYTLIVDNRQVDVKQMVLSK